MRLILLRHANQAAQVGTALPTTRLSGRAAPAEKLWGLLAQFTAPLPSRLQAQPVVMRSSSGENLHSADRHTRQVGSGAGIAGNPPPVSRRSPLLAWTLPRLTDWLDQISTARIDD